MRSAELGSGPLTAGGSDACRAHAQRGPRRGSFASLRMTSATYANGERAFATVNRQPNGYGVTVIVPFIPFAPGKLWTVQ